MRRVLPSLLPLTDSQRIGARGIPLAENLNVIGHMRLSEKRAVYAGAGTARIVGRLVLNKTLRSVKYAQARDHLVGTIGHVHIQPKRTLKRIDAIEIHIASVNDVSLNLLSQLDGASAGDSAARSIKCKVA